MKRLTSFYSYFTYPTLYRAMALAVLAISLVALLVHAVMTLMPRPPFSWPAVSVVCMILAALALALEKPLARLIRRLFVRDGVGIMGKTGVTRRPRRGVPLLHDAMFRYRLTNPDEERMRSELRLARMIQFSMTPDHAAAREKNPDYDIDALLAPAQEVGGDFYDYFHHPDGRLIFAIGDVAGHGMAAAMYMAACHTALRALAEMSASPADLLGRINDTLERDHHSGLYVTMACFFLNLATGETEYALAGHPPPLWHRSATDEWEYVDGPRETVAGVKAGVRYPLGRMTLAPGDGLLLYTDGVPECKGASGEELGYDALLDYCRRQGSGKECGQTLMDLAVWLNRFTGGRDPEDDVTLLALRYTPRIDERGDSLG